MDILQQAQSYIGILSFILLGIFAFFSIFDRFKNKRVQTLSILDEKNISALNQRIAILELDVSNGKVERDKLIKDLTELKTKYDLLTQEGISGALSPILNKKLDTIIAMQNKTTTNIDKLYKVLNKQIKHGK